MILEQLTLRELLPLSGRTDLRPGARHRAAGSTCPSSCFGGINGGGKTTLLDAIQLALYGGRARCSKRTNLSYEDFLRESHPSRHRTGASAAGVSLSFRYAVDGEEHLYDVCRNWNAAGRQGSRRPARVPRRLL